MLENVSMIAKNKAMFKKEDIYNLFKEYIEFIQEINLDKFLATAGAASARTLLSTSGRGSFAAAFVGALDATKS